MERQNKGNRGVVNIGTSLMMVILIGLAFAVIAALAISSSNNNYNLSKKLAEHTEEYYAATNLANEKIAEGNWKNQEFQIDINDSQILSVQVLDREITKWQVESKGDWNAESTQPVITIQD